MIKNEKIEIKINSNNIKHYKKFFDDIKVRNTIYVNYDMLTYGSGVIITAICDICDKEKKLKYQSYIKQTKSDDKYYCKKCSLIKTKKTNETKYGSEYGLQNDKVKEKGKQTLQEKYGIENISQRKDIREKRSERLKDVDYQNEMKKSLKDKYGVDNISKLEFVKIKKKETCLKNNNVESPLQNYDLFMKSQKTGKHICEHSYGLMYRGSYEKNFLDFCLKNNIVVEKGKTVKYEYDGKIKFYHSDFFYKPLNLIIEIKSDYYYEKFKEINEIKRNYCISNGYNFIFIINKNYDGFLKLIKI